MRARDILVLAHRWAGLAITPVIIIAALTGSLLAMRPQLESLLAPAFVATPPAGVEGIDPFRLRERAEARAPGYRFDQISLTREAGSWSLHGTPRSTTDPAAEFAFDPRDGRLVARNIDAGVLPRHRRDIMRFVLSLHYCLAIPGYAGVWIFGVAAILWTIDCFIGAILTFPRRGVRGWSLAWKIKPKARGFRRHLDLHRAGGLWLWGLLFLFAWSSVWQNLSAPVYTPVMKALGFTFSDEAMADLPGGGALASPSVRFAQAARIGEAAVRRDAVMRGYGFRGGYRLTYDAGRGVYAYQARTTLDPGDHGATSVRIDARSGATGRVVAAATTAGDVATLWLGAIHTADLGGLWFRILVALLGLALAAIAVTGVSIWLRKRRSRHVPRAFPIRAPAWRDGAGNGNRTRITSLEG